MQLSAMEMINPDMEKLSYGGVQTALAASRNVKCTQANSALFSAKQTHKPESTRHFSFQ